MGFKTSLVTSPAQLKPELLCCSCNCLVDQPVTLTCHHLACITCLRAGLEGRQRLFNCGLCGVKVEKSLAVNCRAFDGVANWLKVELNSVRIDCPRLCGQRSFRLSELGRHFETECPRTEIQCQNAGCQHRHRRDKSDWHQRQCQFRRTKCAACGRQMQAKEMRDHLVKTGCHELQIKIERRESMKQCHQQVVDHYRLLRQRSLVTMQELRKQQLQHLHRMGIQGFVRRQQLPQVPTAASVEGHVCERCGKSFSANHATACRWHGGPIIETFGGLCLACGKPSHTQGCIISSHAEIS